MLIGWFKLCNFLVVMVGGKVRINGGWLEVIVYYWIIEREWEVLMSVRVRGRLLYIYYWERERFMKEVWDWCREGEGKIRKEGFVFMLIVEGFWLV